MTECRGSSPAAVEVLATRLYVNLAFPERAEEAAALPVGGVGLLQAEFMLTDQLSAEVRTALIARGGADDFVERMAASILRITDRSRPGRSCTGRPTSARTSSASSTGATSSSRTRRTR
ncbi:MAG: hypothetical protein R2699_05915 [Acidimicrobiales bacterium]